MSVMERTKTVVRMEAACEHPSCSQFAFERHHQLDVPKYRDGVSIMDLPSSRAAWEDDHRTARKRAWRSERLGYEFDEVDLSRHNEDCFRINTSLSHRQGRPMSEGYLVKPNRRPLPAYPCDRHMIHTYGVLKGDRLYAYLTLYRVGELGLVSMIIGHGAHLRDDIMWQLFAGVVEDQSHHGGILYYNRHDSGTDGLRYYKERVGFCEGDVEWVL